MRTSPSACLVVSGLIIGGAGGAIALAEPGLIGRPAIQRQLGWHQRRPSERTDRAEIPKTRRPDAEQTPTRNTDDDPTPDQDERTDHQDQRTDQDERSDHGPAKRRRPSERRPSPANRRRPRTDDARNDDDPRAKRRRPRAQPDDDANHDVDRRQVVAVAVDSSRRVFAPTPSPEMQLPPPRLDLALPGIPFEPAGIAAVAGAALPGAAGVPPANCGGVCRRGYRSRALQRFRSHRSRCRWSWPHRSGSGEPFHRARRQGRRCAGAPAARHLGSAPAGREPLPANVGNNVALPASFRVGYANTCGPPESAQIAALAVPGVAGILALTGVGGLVGYRQAKAGSAFAPAVPRGS